MPDAAGGPAAGPWWPLALLWVACDLAGALAGGRNYRHYFLTLAPSLSVAAGFTYWALLARLPHDARARGWAVILGAFIVGPLVVAQAADMRQVLGWGLWPAEPQEKSSSELVAAQLNAIRRPSDTLFTWDYQPRIYLATNMRSPTRQLDGHYLYDFGGSATRYGEELWRTLRRAPPTFIVDGWSATAEAPPEVRDPIYGQFRELLANQYTLLYTAGNLALYRHRLADPANAE